MKVWNKLAEIYNYKDKAELFKILKSTCNCPGAIEAKHELIGDKGMERFCNAGCSRTCMDEYLERRVKS